LPGKYGALEVVVNADFGVPDSFTMRRLERRLAARIGRPTRIKSISLRLRDDPRKSLADVLLERDESPRAKKTSKRARNRSFWTP